MSRSTLCRTGAGQRVASRASMMKVSIYPRKQMELMVKQHPDRAADPTEAPACTPQADNQVPPGPCSGLPPLRSQVPIIDVHHDAESCQLTLVVWLDNKRHVERQFTCSHASDTGLGRNRVSSASTDTGLGMLQLRYNLSVYHKSLCAGNLIPIIAMLRGNGIFSRRWLGHWRWSCWKGLVQVSENLSSYKSE